MKPFTQHEGLVAPLDRSNVDTDQIIPKQFLKRIERTGYEDYLFFDWRYGPDQKPNPEFSLNFPEYRGASILLTRQNFGSGSSREHAVWALSDYGFRTVLAPSFADIFYNNCFKNGVLPVTLPEPTIDSFFQSMQHAPLRLKVDLETQRVTDNKGNVFAFEIDPSRRHKLLNGLDDIALTLQLDDKIKAYEAANPLPSLK